MNKLYTNNFKRITTSYEFPEKFKGYLAFLKLNDLELYNSLMTSQDFKIEHYGKFKDDFNSFFEKWLQDTFNNEALLNIENLEKMFNEISTTDAIFSEFFSYYNLYKRINDGVHNELFFFDITITDSQKEIIKNLNDKKEESLSSLQKEFIGLDLDLLIAKNFIEINNGLAKLTFKAKHAI